MYWIIVKYLNVSVGSTEICDGRKELYGREVTILACALGRIQIQPFKYYEEIAAGWHVMVRAILKMNIDDALATPVFLLATVTDICQWTYVR